MYEFVWVTPQNTLIHRTKNYACEKKYYIYKSLRPQKAALKAYNSISNHNNEYKEKIENYTILNSLDLQHEIKPKVKEQVNIDDFIEFKTKLENVTKIPNSLEIYVRNIKTNKLHGYIIKTLLNFSPNGHEIKNKIVFKTKACKIFAPNDAKLYDYYKSYL